jgi:DegV family protein with EDD domain
LPEGELADLGVAVVPVTISFGGEEFQEGETLGYDEFFARINASGIIPTTSQPSPGRFVQEYRRLAAAGATTVLSLHVTGKLSGTVSSAEMAAQMLRSEVDVRVFDSQAGSGALGFMLREARAMVRNGADADAVLARWSEIRERIAIFFYLDTLKYARMSGRIGSLQYSLASALNIKPLIKLDQGLLEVAERVRSRRLALDRLLVLAREHASSRPVNLAVIHAQDRRGAQELLARAITMLDCRETFVARLASSLVIHLGVGALGVVLYNAD